MRVAQMSILAILLLSSISATAGTTLDFWHSYRHAKTGQMHHGFHLEDCKRGLFIGSCGPSTKSLHWSFNFDLAGDGPVYQAEQITVSDDNAMPLKVVAGQIVTDLKSGKAKIAIEIEQGGATNKFIGNGEYRIKKAK